MYTPEGTFGTIGTTPKWQKPADAHTRPHARTQWQSCSQGGVCVEYQIVSTWGRTQTLRRGLTAGLMMEMKSDERVYICLWVSPCLHWSGSVRLDMCLRSVSFCLSVSSCLPVATSCLDFSPNSRRKKFGEWFCLFSALLTNCNVIVLITYPIWCLLCGWLTHSWGAVELL